MPILLNELKTISAVPSYIDIDKQKEYKEQIEARRKDNKLLDGVIKGHFNLISEYERLASHHINNIATPHTTIEESRPTLKEMEDLVGYFSSNDKLNMVENPIGGGVVGASILGGVGATINYKVMGRRDLLRFFGITALAGMGMGSFVGLSASADKANRYDTIKNNVADLQKIIDNVYIR